MRAIYGEGAIVGMLVTDGDTKTLAHIKANGPEEVAGIIGGSLDLGHLAKNVKKWQFSPAILFAYTYGFISKTKGL